MGTRLNDEINRHLTGLDEEERGKVLQYLQESQTMGNLVLESLFMAQVNAAASLASTQTRMAEIQAQTNEWANKLEPKLQAQAEEFFDGLNEFTAMHAKTMNDSVEGIQRAMREAVESSHANMQARAKELKAELESSFKGLVKQLEAKANTEREKVTGQLVATLNKHLSPHVETAFKNSSDRFSVKALVRDVVVVLVAFGIYSGIKALM